MVMADTLTSTQFIRESHAAILVLLLNLNLNVCGVETSVFNST